MLCWDRSFSLNSASQTLQNDICLLCCAERKGFFYYYYWWGGDCHCDLQRISKDLREEQRIISYYSVWSYLILFTVTCLLKTKIIHLLQFDEDVLI